MHPLDTRDGGMQPSQLCTVASHPRYLGMRPSCGCYLGCSHPVHTTCSSASCAPGTRDGGMQPSSSYAGYMRVCRALCVQRVYSVLCTLSRRVLGVCYAERVLCTCSLARYYRRCCAHATLHPLKESTLEVPLDGPEELIL